ncbi:MAG TPA: RES domain-containing protein [Thermoanaerobaculia bacterium]
MSEDRLSIPPPPERPPGRLPPLAAQQPIVSWRIHAEANPLEARQYPTGKFRFDAPTGQYPVTYVNLDRHACYAEVFGDVLEIPPWSGRRLLSQVRSNRPLQLIALDRAEVLKAFGLDLNICSSLDYARTRAWSRAWHEWYPQADGIRYLGRHAVQQRNVCLYLDRCGGDLEAGLEGHLQDLRRDGLVAAHKYNLAPRLFFPAS